MSFSIQLSDLSKTCREKVNNIFTPYAQTFICVNLILFKLFSCLVITFQGGGVTTCKFDRILPLDLLYLPIPTRTRNEGVRP